MPTESLAVLFHAHVGLVSPWHLDPYVQKYTRQVPLFQ